MTNDFPWIVRWKLENGASSNDLVPECPVPLPKEVGWEAISPISAGSGVCAFHYRGELHQPATFYADINPDTAFADEPSLMIRVVDSGHVRTILSDDIVESQGRYGLYLLDPTAKHALWNRPNEVNEAFVLQVSCSELRKMVGAQYLGARIERALSGRPDFFCAAPRVSPVLLRAVRDIRHAPFAGPFSELYRRGRIIEALAVALGDLDDGIPSEVRRVVSADARKAGLARDIFMADLLNPPSVESLAAQVGVSQRRLNAIFKDAYGMTVFSCMVAWRLDMARTMLDSGELSVKQVAYMLGYSHPNNFVHAFGRRFGTSPGRWKNKD
ncbi:helix-turn-helix transcriptional regulator [Magnetovibrio blakemorei]|uniref:AraC family transcriptional regulatory protein n=1 Tax=Magnetovibrio blakemorei TaxID=28181 RepID=C4RAI2_9PROT|nr:AraC family transcriptional regulator [Magnetovibrio blakemorei]OEJ67241.1 hypothetical protein BEN30_09665 [Magnetovibrio blakemorei]CAV30827.1 AraC family transcriptional regulatory protein [Magnetovibrio blakemorei]